MEKLKNSTQGIESGEWLGFLCILVVNPSPKFYTSKEFWPSVGTSLQKGMELPKDLKVYSIRNYSTLMILFKERKGLTCISRWVRIGVKIGAHDTNFNVATLALGSRPRQRGCKGAGQREAQESHQRLPGVQENVRD